MPFADLYEQINKQMNRHEGAHIGDQERWHILREVLDWIGRPDEKLRFIHIVGTDGKHAAGAMTAAILTAANYKTGRFTTPAIMNDCDMILVDNESITQEEFVLSFQRILEEIKRHGGDITTLSRFEWWFLVSIEHFRRQEVKYVVLEAGIDGMCDPTNAILETLLVAFTHIDFDYKTGQTPQSHQLTAIALDKSGAIKPGAVVVNMPGQHHEVTKVLKTVTAEKNAVWYSRRPKITVMKTDPTGMVLKLDDGIEMRLSVVGSDHLKNLANVLQIIGYLQETGAHISLVNIAEALAYLKISGRMTYDAAHDILFDGADSTTTMEHLLSSIKSWHLQAKPIFVLGLRKDENWREILDMVLPYTDQVIAVTPAHHEGMHADELAAKIVMQSNVNVEVADDSTAAINLARRARRDTNRMIVVTGSLFTLRAINKEGLTFDEY
ncbi:bifunctional folylpolyglutamate synthase/dihydrofolate synthase [Weissella tructae]